MCEDCDNQKDEYMDDSYSGIKVSWHENNKVSFRGKGKRGRYIAAEIEVDRSDVHKAKEINRVLNKWGAVAVEDGSLDYQGYEINTAPAKDSTFVREIREICKALNDAQANVNSSCGLHIHVDARDVGFAELRRILRTYVNVEKDLFSMVAPSRRRSHYCNKVPSWVQTIVEKDMDVQQFRKDLIQRFYGTSDPNDYRYNTEEKDGGDRYWALNIQSWFYRKTFEFRLHQGSVNPTKIIAWGKICESIINFGVNNSDEDIKRHFTNNDEPLGSILSPSLKAYFLERRKHFAKVSNR